MAKFKVNGVELEFDLYELKNAELYEREKEKVLRICEGVKSETKLSKIIKIQCNAVFDFVNALFGKGTDKKLFGEETNLTKCVDTFIRLSDELNKANAKEMDKINENIGKTTE